MYPSIFWQVDEASHFFLSAHFIFSAIIESKPFNWYQTYLGEKNKVRFLFCFQLYLAALKAYYLLHTQDSLLEEVRINPGCWGSKFGWLCANVHTVFSAQQRLSFQKTFLLNCQQSGFFKGNVEYIYIEIWN